MGFKINKRIKIAPGVNLNIGKKGISTSVKIGNTTFNSRGKVTTRIVPGVSYSTNIKSKNNKKVSNKSFENTDNKKVPEISLKDTSDKIINKIDNTNTINIDYKKKKIKKTYKPFKDVFYEQYNEQQNSPNSWANLSDKQVKLYNILMKTLLTIITTLFILLSFSTPFVLIIAIFMGIYIFKFDANKLRLKHKAIIEKNKKIKSNI